MLSLTPKKASQKILRELRKEFELVRNIAYGCKGTCIFRHCFVADNVTVTVEWWKDGMVRVYSKDYGLRRRTDSESVMQMYAVMLTRKIVDAYK